MLSVESIYQSKLGKFYDVAENGAARLGSSPGVFSDLLSSIEARLALSDSSTVTETDTTVNSSDTELTTSNSTPEIEAAVEYAAQKTGVDADLIRAVIQVESSFRVNAESGCGAQGLMQLMPGTAEEMGVEDPFDAYDNVMGGAGYLKKMLNRFGDVRLALAAYNRGQGKVASLKITDPDDPEQYEKLSSGARGYISKVLSYWEQFENS
jgi:soluble lytic murein transglycosylase-like protein